MSRSTTIAVLFLAAMLEAGGDALIRACLHKTLPWQKASLFAVAARVLFACGCTVNSPPWDFGKLLGLYVVFFFLTAQTISWLAFKQLPSLAVLVGGLFILTGGIIIATANTQGVTLRLSFRWRARTRRSEIRGAIVRVLWKRVPSAD
jgi:hypothetical protein